MLRELGHLAEACIDGESSAQDAVAFALATIFLSHADDRDDRPVNGDDTYRLVSMADNTFTDAVYFVVKGGSNEDAIKIVAALAHLTPKILYGH